MVQIARCRTWPNHCARHAPPHDALSLLANLVMAWNTAKMQAIFDRWARCRNGAIPPELIARCAPRV
jgi:Tn3 transposase DDE domain